MISWQRILVFRIAVWFIRLRGALSWPCRRCLYCLTDLEIANRRRQNERKRDSFNADVADLGQKCHLVTEEISLITKQGWLVSQDRKHQLLANNSALLARADVLRSRAIQLNSAPLPTTTTDLIAVLQANREMLLSRQKKLAELGRIRSRINSSRTFYVDMLLWLVLPSTFSEDVLGDMNEEYSVRIVSVGSVEAKNWYKTEAIKSMGDYIWERVCRLAAVATLIDLVRKLFE